MSASRATTRLPRALLRAAVLGILAALAVWSLECVAYLEASRQYEALMHPSPADRAAVESRLRLYVAREISQAESLWGKNDEPIRPGEYLRQYLILGTQPIDVVYDASNRVVAVYSSDG